MSSTPASPIEKIEKQQALSDLSNNPVFSQIKTDEIVPQIESAIAACKQAIEDAVSSGDVSYVNVVTRLEEADDALGKLFSPVSHMNSVVSNDDLREAHDACLPLLSEYSTFVGQHEGLYKLYQALQDSDAFADLNEAQQKVVNNGVRDFTLSGVALDPSKKEHYAKIKSRLSDLSSRIARKCHRRSCTSSASKGSSRIFVYSRYTQLLTSNDVCRQSVATRRHVQGLCDSSVGAGYHRW
jgi:oligopeptidase A